MNKLYNLKIKEGASLVEHLKTFNMFINLLAFVKIVLSIEIKGILFIFSMRYGSTLQHL